MSAQMKLTNFKKVLQRGGFIFALVSLSIIIAKEAALDDESKGDPDNTDVDYEKIILKMHPFSSTMPEKYFNEMEWLEIGSDSDSKIFMYLRVQTVTRIPSSNDVCVTFLELDTLHGTILLDEFDLYYDDAVANAFLETGLITSSDIDVASSLLTNRGCMRRLSGEGLSVGLFTTLARGMDLREPVGIPSWLSLCKHSKWSRYIFRL
jgi:hypothetical protein